MSYSAKILLDSISPDNVRLITMEVTFPRIILAEFNTHRVLSRNSSSSRAIPVEKQIKRVMEDPFIPSYWGKNQKGMKAELELSGLEKIESEKEWLKARDLMVEQAQKLLTLGVHKQLTNRLLEPFMWQTVITTATEWSNLYALRAHADAQPEFKQIADMMIECVNNSTSRFLNYGEWHLPLIQSDELTLFQTEGFNTEDTKRISSGRCCRVSYLTHDGKRDPQADISLCGQLLSDGHMSPLEHPARPMTKDEITYWQIKGNDSDIPFCGNFRGWIQFRKEVPNEADFGRREYVA